MNKEQKEKLRLKFRFMNTPQGGKYTRSAEGEARRLAALRTPEFRQRVSQTSKLTHSDPEVRKRISEGTKRGLTPEIRAKMSRDRKGHPMSEEHYQKLSKMFKGRQGTFYAPGQKKRGTKIGHINSPEHRKKNSQAMLKRWQDPIIREKMIRDILNMRSPNKRESELLDFLNANFNNEWKFVGDGTLIIDCLNPDIVNINSKKLLVELFGEFFHKYQEVGFRKRVFAKFGYKTLVIWQRELKDKEKLLVKVGDWLEESK